MTEKRFYMTCTRERVGSNEGFWCKDGAGYTTNLDKAHVYTLDEAQKAWDKGREIDIPISIDEVYKLSRFKVDHQYIPSKTTITESNDYVCYIYNEYDGNDVLFITGGLPSTDFSYAKSFTKDDIKDISWARHIFIPRELADKVKRRTFDFKLIDYMKMTFSTGLKAPEHFKKYMRTSDWYSLFE